MLQTLTALLGEDGPFKGPRKCLLPADRHFLVFTRAKEVMQLSENSSESFWQTLEQKDLRRANAVHLYRS